MFLDILELGIKKTKKEELFRENCFKNVVSEIHKMDLFCPYDPPKIRNMCKLRHKVCNGSILLPWSPNFQNYFFKSIFADILSHCFTNLRPHNQNSFFYTILFSIPSSGISTNMCKWRQKLQNIEKSVGPPFTWWNEAWYNLLAYSYDKTYKLKFWHISNFYT